MAEEKKAPVKKKDQGAKTWFDGLKAEFKKIVWTDRPTLVKQTIVVTVITIIMGALISIMDAGILGVLNVLI
ncbi:MAG: preprotein translocase subunit SecE [Blautia sp.]|nr:preprotein translocase subunit SecE [Blautia sp.]